MVAAIFSTRQFLQKMAARAKKHPPDGSCVDGDLCRYSYTVITVKVTVTVTCSVTSVTDLRGNWHTRGPTGHDGIKLDQII